MITWLVETIQSYLSELSLVDFATLIGGLAAIWFFWDKVKDSSALGKIKLALSRYLNTVMAYSQWRWATIRCKISPFYKRYNKHLIDTHRLLNVRGLRTPGDWNLDLAEVFVKLRISILRSSKVRLNPISFKKEELTNSYQIWDLMRKRLVWAIIGAPGCGKTTLLKHIALTLATNKQYYFNFPHRMPVLLFLRDHVFSITESETSLVEKSPLTLAGLLHNRSIEIEEKYSKLSPPHWFEKLLLWKIPGKEKNSLKLIPPLKWFEKLLHRGKCVVLLDGLDEVADSKQRQIVSTWIEKQIIRYPRCHFIITGRPQGYLSTPITDALILEVQPFTREQVRYFIKGWYL